MKKLWIFLPILVFTTLLLAGCGNKNNVGNVDNLAVQADLEEQVDALESKNEDLSYPKWLKDLNIEEPKWLELKKDESYLTTEKVEWFNSVHFEYNWDYDTAMSEAKKIANNAWIELSQEFAAAQEMIENMGIENINMQELMWDMKWALYTNYTLIEKPDFEYMISITVDESWLLEIDVVDRVAMEKIAKDYSN